MCWVVTCGGSQRARVMPPMASRTVVFPALWLAAFLLFRELHTAKEDLFLGAISTFDGTPRPGRLSDHLTAAGIQALSFDVMNSLKQNVLDMTGVQVWLDALARLAPDSLVWLCPSCSSWGWLPRSVSGRSHADPLGRDGAWVYAANQTAEFLCRAMLAATSIGKVQFLFSLS